MLIHNSFIPCTKKEAYKPEAISNCEILIHSCTSGHGPEYCSLPRLYYYV